MKFRAHILMLLGVMFFGIFVTSATLANEAPTSNLSSGSGPITYICSNAVVPSGYVVVSSGTNYQCPGNAVYRWGIQPAYNGMIACLGSSYPSPYFITGEANDSSNYCTGFLGRMTLSTPSNGLVACVNGVMWSPWVITANGTSTQCNGYGTITISQPAQNLRICSNSVVPSGWTVGSQSQFYLCQPYLAEVMQQTVPSTVGKTPSALYTRDGDRAVLMLNQNNTN
jgi:hypothetical protein